MDLDRLGSGDSSLRLGVLSAADAAQCFDAAQREFAYEKMVGTTGKPLPRVQCLQARARPDGTLPVYRYPGNEEGVRYPTHPLSPLTERVCALAQRELERASPDALAAAALAEGEPYFNHVVVNYYRSESDFIASHQDKRLDIARNAVIAALSVYPSLPPAAAAAAGALRTDPAGPRGRVPATVLAYCPWPRPAGDREAILFLIYAGAPR